MMLAVARHEEVPLALADARQARQLPGVVPVQLHRRDDVELELLPLGHLLQVELQQLLLRRVEPETRKLINLLHRCAAPPLMIHLSISVSTLLLLLLLVSS